MAGLRAIRYVMMSCLLFSLAGCARNPPLVECTGSVVTTVVSDSCEPGLWDVPIDVKVDGQLIGSIGIDRARFGPFKYSNRQRKLEFWAGLRQVDSDGLRCELGEHREFSFELRHIGSPTNAPGPMPCEGRDCLAAKYATQSRGTCITASFVNPRSITTPTPSAQTCNATIQRVVKENSCAPGLWDVPIEVRLSGHVIGSIEPGAPIFGPFPYGEPDPWIELWVGKRRLAELKYSMSCRDAQPLTLKLAVWHQEFIQPTADYADCEGTQCLASAKVIRPGTYCFSTFDLDRADMHE